MTAVGVLGGAGAVGRETVAQLRAWGLGPVVVAGRGDVGDPDAMDRFLDGVGVVVNCTASPPAARAALAARGLPYVDPGGDEPVHDRLAGADLRAPVVLSAGMLPGLTGLLPRRLAAPGTRLTVYAGGRDRFSTGAAEDYLASVHDAAGRAFAVWRHGARAERAGTAEKEVPCFPEPASGVPYLSAEMERLARDLGVTELAAYTVFPGERLRETLATAGVDAAAIVRASELDLFGRTRYQRLVFRLPDEPGAPALVLTGRGSSELTGATAALTVLAVLDGAVPPGLHYAAEVLDPVWAMDRLRTAGAVTELRIVADERADEDVEEGVL